MEAGKVFRGSFVAFSDFDRAAIRVLINRVNARRVLEVGSWLGNGSTQELGAHCDEVYCVDHWQGNPGVQRHQELIETFDVFATFQANTAIFGRKIRPLMMSSKDAAAVVAENAFDLIFLDADHTYEATLADIGFWRSKVRRGGILCGHDCEGRPDDFGRLLLDEARDLDTIESARFPRIHPGCILAIDEGFSGRANLFSEAELTLGDGRKGFSTIWYVTT
jgi:hypothetical protein